MGDVGRYGSLATQMQGISFPSLFFDFFPFSVFPSAHPGSMTPSIYTLRAVAPLHISSKEEEGQTELPDLQ